MNNALKLYNIGIFSIYSTESHNVLNIFVKYDKNSFLYFAIYFKCVGPIPVGPHALCFLRCLIVFLTSSYVISANCTF
jgi:hypothetical protein